MRSVRVKKRIYSTSLSYFIFRLLPFSLTLSRSLFLFPCYCCWIIWLLLRLAYRRNEGSDVARKRIRWIARLDFCRLSRYRLARAARAIQKEGNERSEERTEDGTGRRKRKKKKKKEYKKKNENEKKRKREGKRRAHLAHSHILCLKKKKQQKQRKE